MSDIKHLIHAHSNVTDENGNPILPESSRIEYGEIAVNYATDKETISLRNEDDEIVTFSSDKVRTENELVISSALNDLNERIVEDTATEFKDGLMSKEDKAKLDTLISGLATTGSDGYMSSLDKAKLDSIPTGLVSVTADGWMSSTDKIKLNGIEDGATRGVTFRSGSARATGDTISLVGYGMTARPSGNEVELALTYAVTGGGGMICIGYTPTGDNYAVELDSNNKAFVNVPWTDTTYSQATRDDLGLVRIINARQATGDITSEYSQCITTSDSGILYIPYAYNRYHSEGVVRNLFKTYTVSDITNIDSDTKDAIRGDFATEHRYEGIKLAYEENSIYYVDAINGYYFSDATETGRPTFTFTTTRGKTIVYSYGSFSDFKTAFNLTDTDCGIIEGD